MNNKSLNLEPKGDYRLFVISDIHGHDRHLDALIKKIHLKDEDYLVILGDFINKGPNSYRTLQMVQDLAKRPRTIVLKGNHEFNIQRVMSQSQNFENVYDHIQNEHTENIIHSIMRASHKHCAMYNSPKDHYQDLLEHHQESFDFKKTSLSSLTSTVLSWSTVAMI